VSPLDNEGGEVHKNGCSHRKKTAGMRKALLAAQKRRLHAKSCWKRPPACTERLKAGEKASHSHGKAKSWLLAGDSSLKRRSKIQSLVSQCSAFKWVKGGSNSPGRSDWLTAQTAKSYVSAGNMIASWQKWAGRPRMYRLKPKAPLNSHNFNLQHYFNFSLAFFQRQDFALVIVKEKNNFQNDK